jgi:DHA2 family multidrug resistance protein
MASSEYSRATVGGLASLAPTLGPTLGGWITEHASWHWLFYHQHWCRACSSPSWSRSSSNIDKADLSLLRGADYLGMICWRCSWAAWNYTLEEGPRWTGSATARSGTAMDRRDRRRLASSPAR